MSATSALLQEIMPLSISRFASSGSVIYAADILGIHRQIPPTIIDHAEEAFERVSCISLFRIILFISPGDRKCTLLPQLSYIALLLYINVCVRMGSCVSQYSLHFAMAKRRVCVTYNCTFTGDILVAVSFFFRFVRTCFSKYLELGQSE